MAKKLKELTKKGQVAQDELVAKQKEIELLIIELEKEKEAEIKRREGVTVEFEDLCKRHEVFCGVVLSVDDIGTIMKLLVMNKGVVKIPFALYYNEDNEIEDVSSATIIGNENTE